MSKSSRARAEAAHAEGTASPVKPARHIPQPTKILLAVRAGGRCEFGGCNQYLFEHPLTLRRGNFSENAHIVAFSEQGPRGQEGDRPDDVHATDNLMLLCQPCHKEIDDRPEEYPRAVLEQYKKEHEDRIRLVTGMGPDKRTSIVQLKSRIGGDAVDIPAPQIYEAIAPRFPADEKGTVIDLTAFGDDQSDEYYKLAAGEIERAITRLYEPGMSAEATRHISLFALAQIPLLMFLGRSLSNKIAVDFYQRHRTEENPWKWPEDGEPTQYAIDRIREGTDPKNVALVLGLSGPIPLETLPVEVDGSFSIYEITLENKEPGTDFLRCRQDLEAFRQVYRSFLAAMTKHHPTAEELHVFPAVPAPIAIVCGHDLLPKVHPILTIYDNDNRQGGFINRLKVNEHENE